MFIIAKEEGEFCDQITERRIENNLAGSGGKGYNSREEHRKRAVVILPEGKEESIMAGKTAVSCETCTYYTFDEDYEEYVCDMDMDEDEYIRLISDSHYECPYYRNGDDYRIVRKQM